MSVKNPKVVVYSIIAIFFLILTFLIDWLFIVPVLILIYLNQKELFKKSLKKKKNE